MPVHSTAMTIPFVDDAATASAGTTVAAGRSLALRLLKTRARRARVKAGKLISDTKPWGNSG